MSAADPVMRGGAAAAGAPGGDDPNGRKGTGRDVRFWCLRDISLRY